MPKEKLNKFMKERSGAAVTKDEADRLKKEISGGAAIGSAAEAMSADALKNISGAGISDAERDRLKKVSRSGVAGSVGEAMGASVTDAERERLQDSMPDYADGGEVVFGKGKDYIKDLL